MKPLTIECLHFSCIINCLQVLCIILVSFFYKKEVECHKTHFFGDLGESGSEQMAGTSANGVLGVPRGIPSCGAGGSIFKICLNFDGLC